MPEFSCLLGQHALSDFRKQKLLRSITSRTGLETGLEARFCYLLELNQALSETLIMSFAAAATKILNIREKYLPQIKTAPNEEAASKIFKKAQTEMRAILTVEKLTER